MMAPTELGVNGAFATEATMARGGGVDAFKRRPALRQPQPANSRQLRYRAAAIGAFRRFL